VPFLKIQPHPTKKEFHNNTKTI